MTLIFLWLLSDLERCRLTALDNFVPHRHTDGQSDKVTPWAPVGAKKYVVVGFGHHPGKGRIHNKVQLPPPPPTVTGHEHGQTYSTEAHLLSFKPGSKILKPSFPEKGSYFVLAAQARVTGIQLLVVTLTHALVAEEPVLAMAAEKWYPRDLEPPVWLNPESPIISGLFWIESAQTASSLPRPTKLSD